jgi:hypothetical protein
MVAFGTERGTTALEFLAPPRASWRPRAARLQREASPSLFVAAGIGGTVSACLWTPPGSTPCFRRPPNT